MLPNRSLAIGAVLARMGDIFEGSADLIVLPCSAKGTVSSATARWIEMYQIPSPQDLQVQLNIGGVTDLILFPGSKHITKFIIFAASVFNDYSSVDAIEKIGREIGTITIDNPEIQIIEVPLLGTGAGGLMTEGADVALAKGFKSSFNKNSTLYIFVFDKERFTLLNKKLNEGFLSSIWSSIGFKLGLLGISVDLKKLFRGKK